MILANIIESAFGPLIKVFEAVLIAAHSVVGGSWGWAIIGLTIVIRIVTLPLMLTQFRNMAKLQLHAGPMNEIKQRYKDDKQRQSEEMMKYYKEQGVNPLGGCLPLLVQFPVLISLFYMLRTDLKQKICGQAIKANHITTKLLPTTGCSSLKGAHGSASFLFINDITVKATGAALIVLIVLYIATMLTTSYFSTAQLQGSQRYLMLAMPLIFTAVIYRYPAGLLIYWVTTNLTQLPLQWFVRRRVGTAPPVAPPAAVAGNGAGKPSAARSVLQRARPAAAEPKAAASQARPSRSGPPPQSPRKRKKRSGRRR
ncbi:MAG: YidC/Oxa1 family membrane protein insertase [Solirubrobacteraceae bacterium]|jgi:YidC/Oxa1 family membrane protein insertase